MYFFWISSTRSRHSRHWKKRFCQDKNEKIQKSGLWGEGFWDLKIKSGGFCCDLDLGMYISFIDGYQNLVCFFRKYWKKVTQLVFQIFVSGQFLSLTLLSKATEKCWCEVFGIFFSLAFVYLFLFVCLFICFFCLWVA